VLLRLAQEADLTLVALSLVISVVMNVASAFKWQLLLRSRGHRVSLWQLAGYYYVGKFFNLVLPTSMGGDVVRIWVLGRHTGSGAEATASVLVERFSGMVTMMLLVLVALLVNRSAYGHPLITFSLAAGTAVIAVLIWLALDRRPLMVMERRLAGHRGAFHRLLGRLAALQSAVAAYGDDRVALAWALVNSLGFYALAVVNIWVSTLAFSRQIDFHSILLTVPAILLIMNLPISFGGIGLMEFACSFAFAMVGYSQPLAFSCALLLRLKSFVDAALGGSLHLSLGTRRMPGRAP
jgi:hypothetical protein